MKVNASKTLQRISQWYFVFCCSMCLLVTLLPYWPYHKILIIPKYVLLFGPRWWLLLTVIVLLLFWKLLSKKQLLSSILLFLLSLNFLGFQLPSIGEYFSSSNINNDITTLSANVGGGGSTSGVNFIAKNLKPDFILLQEARNINLSKQFTDYKFKECLSGLCFFSKYPFEQTKVLSRKTFGGWGDFAIFYRIKTESGTISLANVHFETPRTVLMGAIHRSFDLNLASDIDSNRQFQALMLSLWAKNKEHTLIIGDFNMPMDENIYETHFSELNNALDVKGVGFNPTKHTFWHGIVIDHVLYSDDFQLIDVEVVSPFSGDHRPILSRLKIKS
jgi:vancomycin resistance protein VanJ